MNAKEIAEANRKGAVAGEVEEEVESVGVHVRDGVPEASAGSGGVEPVALDQHRDDERVKEAGEDAVDRTIQVAEEVGARPLELPIFGETTVTVDRAGRDRGEEKDEGEKLNEW